MRVFLTGGSGVLGRAVTPLLMRAGHDVAAPTHAALDLFDPDEVELALSGAQTVFHLATRIPPREAQGDREAWRENDRLRREATKVLVDSAIAAGVERLVFPSITFVYPPSGRADESTQVGDGATEVVQSALAAEHQVARFAESGQQAVVLRLGLLYGPGTGSPEPSTRYKSFGATLRIEDAGQALVAGLDVPSGVYNVVSDDERVSNARFKQLTGWRPEHANVDH